MLAATRRFAKSWVALILIGLLIVSFAIFGINDVFQGTPRDAVVTVGDRTVTSAEYRQEFENARRRAEEQFGQPVTAEFAAQNGLDRQVLEGLVQRSVLGEIMHRLGVRPSGNLVTKEIQKIPAFFDPITGAFDRQAYEQALQGVGATPAKFEEDLADQIAQQHLGAAIAAGFTAPRSYAALTVLQGLEERDAAFFVITGASVPQPAPPTEAQLNQFMKENAAQLTRPEYRVLTVVRFSPNAAAAAGPISDADIKARFDYRKDTMSQAETRSLVQIPAKDAAAAQTIAQRLTKGEDPEAVAKAVGVEPVVYEDKPRTAIADRKVAEAAFKLAQGQVSAPIQGDLGLAVVKVTEVTPGRAPTLEEARPVIEAELRQEAAAKAVYEKSEVYEEAHTSGANLAEAAQKAGVPAQTLPPVSRQGADQQNQPVAGVTPQMLEIAFDLPEGGESDLQDTGQGEYYALRVEKIIKSSMPPLAEIRGPLTQAWMQRQMQASLQAKAEELSARLKRGESLEAVAASAGGSPLQRAVGLNRRTAGQNTQVPPAILERIFAARPGETFTAMGQGLAIAVGKLEAVRPPQVSEAAQFTQAVRPQLAPAMFQDLVASLEQAARRKLEPKVDHDRARQALGLEPAADGDAKGGAAKSGAGR
ncbi:peptidylprolyl isomerase [Phenylobacterium sp.]|jgi:peptidyl-prolyl cis-trans isomerase D|uniref:peptidylprolyl isomerase n=1 Tax=Phenylobacterium sp. TaxID=1871053 RepID=UPI002E3547F8|nr:SurA N-terminal domain-containing protein [Phenylobacterium sp.]HEX2561234.1 SurA N-terminal domain-containing protein [Phenylobacterium sp.]